MAIAIIDNGSNNHIEIPEAVLRKGNGRIVLDGDNNSFVVSSPTYEFGGYFHMAGEAGVVIGRNVNAANLFVYAARGAELRIGEEVGFNGIVRLLMHEPGKITVGDNCLFASEVDVTISDMHSILDATTMRRINPAQDITIGNKVWIGQRAMILKGIRIGDGSVIGAGSVVTKSIPAQCAAAGNPARLIKPNVTWDKKLL